MTEKEYHKWTLIMVYAMGMLLVLCSFMLARLYVAEFIGKYEDVNEFITINKNDIKEFPPDADISCQDGAVVNKYSHKVVIFGCMRLVNGKCGGDEKEFAEMRRQYEEVKQRIGEGQ
jgi:hypothetical protein